MKNTKVSNISGFFEGQVSELILLMALDIKNFLLGQVGHIHKKKC